MRMVRVLTRPSPTCKVGPWHWEHPSDCPVQIYVYGPLKFFKAKYNVVDVVLLLLTTVGLGVPALNFAVILRLFHLLRVHLAGTHIHTILFGGGQPMKNLVIPLLFWLTMLLTFSYMGVFFFSGTFFYCLRCPPDEHGHYARSNCQIVSNESQFCNQSTCEAAPYYYNASNPSNGTYQIWSQPATHFDNLYQASLSFLRLTLNADWQRVSPCSCHCSGLRSRCSGDAVRRCWVSQWRFYNPF